MKIFYIMLICLSVLGYQNCAPTHSTNGYQSNNSQSFVSSLSYEKTLFPILRSKCATCHGVSQQPLFAVSNALVSHDQLINNSLVNLVDSADSRIVVKIKSGHQAFSLEDADEIEMAILNWTNDLQLGNIAPLPATTPTTPTTLLPGTNQADSVLFYESSLFPIIQNNCFSCHGVNQQPMFALSDLKSSHDALLSFGLVDFVNPGSSRLVSKIKSGHQNFSITWANNIETAIQTWSTNLQNSGGGALPSAPVLQATFSSIHSLILVPKCVGCHSPTGVRKSEDYSDYGSTIRTGKVSPKDANNSEMYKECVNGSMPPKAPSLTAAELQVMRDWINQGALNN